jgi:outer membrane protein OmpA-like peptidoglycan-associated protein
MKQRWTITLFLALSSTIAVKAQQNFTNMPAEPEAHLDITAGYSMIRANAPPGGCQCFTASGGFVSADYVIARWLGVTGEFTDSHADKISSLGQSLDLMTFTGGPKITWVNFHLSPFVQFLAGQARASHSYFPSPDASTSAASSFAYAAGGGVDWNLNPRFAVRPIDVKFLHTGFPNGGDNAQRQLQMGAGLVMHIGRRAPREYALIAEPSVADPQVDFECTVPTANVTVGEHVEVVGRSSTTPADSPLNYSWTASGGVVSGSGDVVTVDTSQLAPGSYHVDGHASLKSKPSVRGACEASFIVAARAESAPVPVAVHAGLAPDTPENKDFQNNVSALFFDLDKAELRPDAWRTLELDAVFLQRHPTMKFGIAGSSDERGSTDYNISLGLQRAVATRDALAQLGIDKSRMKVLSYGKEAPLCTEASEECYQQNRRVQFLLNFE